MAIALLVLTALLAATAVTARPDGFDMSARNQQGGDQQWHPELRVPLRRPKDEEDVGQEEEPPNAPAGPPGGASDTVVISQPPPGASVAEARPIATAIAGVGGVAAAKPVATAIVGPAGLAVARPVAIAIAGVQLTPESLASLPGLGGPVAQSAFVVPFPLNAYPLPYDRAPFGNPYLTNGYPLTFEQHGSPYLVNSIPQGFERSPVGPGLLNGYPLGYETPYLVNGNPLGFERSAAGPAYLVDGHPQNLVGPATSHVRVSQPGKMEYSQVVVHSS